MSHQKESIRQCGVAEATRKDKRRLEKDLVMSGDFRERSGDPRRRCAGVLATEGTLPGWGLLFCLGPQE